MKMFLFVFLRRGGWWNGRKCERRFIECWRQKIKKKAKIKILCELTEAKEQYTLYINDKDDWEIRRFKRVGGIGSRGGGLLKSKDEIIIQREKRNE